LFFLFLFICVQFFVPVLGAFQSGERPIIFSLRSLRLPVLGAFCPGSERTLLRVTRNLSSK